MPNKNIEVEIRSFITEEQHNRLLLFFSENAQFVKEDLQETHYFDCPEDIRIQKNNKGGKIWMKKGQIHDDSREEIEIFLDNEGVDKIAEILSSIGLRTEIKWIRNRKQFNWQGIKVCLDHTKGYGYIIELEKMETEENKEQALWELEKKAKELNINLTSKEEFEKRFQHYKQNWRTILENANK